MTAGAAALRFQDAPTHDQATRSRACNPPPTKIKWDSNPQTSLPPFSHVLLLSRFPVTDSKGRRRWDDRPPIGDCADTLYFAHPLFQNFWICHCPIIPPPKPHVFLLSGSFPFPGE